MKPENVVAVARAIEAWEREVVPAIEALDDRRRDALITSLVALDLRAACRLLRDVVCSDAVGVAVVRAIGALGEISAMQPYVADLVFGYGTDAVLRWVESARVSPSVASDICYHISPIYRNRLND